jgi:hypothetical protein
MHNEKHAAGAEQVSQDTLEAICRLTRLGSSPEAISFALDLKVQTIIQVISKGDFGTMCRDLEQEGNQYIGRSQCKQAQLAQEAMLQRLQAQSDKTQTNALNRDLVETSLLDTREAFYHLHEVPTFIYSYKTDTDQLHRTNLVTGEHSSHRVPSYTFKLGCCWSEVPGGSLLITGGKYRGVREVVRIDTRREFAASGHPPMLTPRYCHTAVYHTPHLYILGGSNGRCCLRQCERYVCAEARWEALPPLPTACAQVSGVVVENSLYALGGLTYDSALDLVQKLSLESLTWELMELRLPYCGYSIPCFKLRDTEVYLVVHKTLCSFTAYDVDPLKTLTEDIQSKFGASYYCSGTLYCSNDEGGVRSLDIAYEG